LTFGDILPTLVLILCLGDTEFCGLGGAIAAIQVALPVH